MKRFTDSKWIRTASDRQAIADGCYFDEAAAQRVRRFFSEFVCFSNGKPFHLLDWQYDGMIAPMFGWKRPDGRRRFSRAYLSTPKKNGKTTLLAGVALYLLLADGEKSSEVYSAAGDREQAGIIYREAAKMVRASPHLAKMVRDKPSTKRLIVGAGDSFYAALSADAGTKEGLNAHGILFDELHTQPGRALWDCLRYAGAARSQPISIAITTAGGDLNTICGEQYTYAKRVLGGEIIDTSFFAAVYEASPTDDWQAESTWYKANPSLGITIGIDQFRADATEARETPAKENSFRRYRLNQWVQTADAWLSMEQWDAGKDPIDLESLAGRTCRGGIDLSATDDTTALVLVFPDDDGGITVLPWFFLPEQNIHALERMHRAPYHAWARQGLFTLTPGNVVDYSAVVAKAQELAGLYDVREWLLDRKFQGQAVETAMADLGLPVTPAGQGWVSQDLPAKQLEIMLKAGKVRHGGHPVLRWHASNVVVDIDKAGNYSINKKRSRSKIDGIAALLMGIMGNLNGGGHSGGSFYGEDQPSLIVL